MYLFYCTFKHYVSTEWFDTTIKNKSFLILLVIQNPFTYIGFSGFFFNIKKNLRVVRSKH